MPRAPLVFGYCHSTPGIGLDLESQKEIISDYFRRHLEPAGYKWCNWCVDSGESRRFQERPAGDRLMEHAWRGDVIVVAKADRVCHSVNDLLRTLEYFAESGIEFHIAGDELDASGLPIGLCWKGPRGWKKLIRDAAQREIMGIIVEMRRSEMMFEQITLRLAKDGIRHRRASTKKPRPYSKDTVWRMYHQELLLRWLEEEEADFSNLRVVRLVLSYTQNPVKYRDVREQLDTRAMAGELWT